MSEDKLLSAKKNADNNDEILQWVTFKLEDETYGVNVMQVQEILRYTEIAPVPGAPSFRYCLHFRTEGRFLTVTMESISYMLRLLSAHALRWSAE